MMWQLWNVFAITYVGVCLAVVQDQYRRNMK